MGVVTSFEPDESFWDLNPQLHLDPTLKAFQKSDKSRGKKDSSSAMWWVAFCYDLDPDNKWRGQPLDEKQALLGEELLGNPDFYQKNKKLLDPLIAAYIKLTDTPAKRQLRMLEQKMDEKTATMSRLPYNEDNYEVLDKMMVSDDKLYTLLAKVQKQLSVENAEGEGKGGGTASISDNGEI